MYTVYKNATLRWTLMWTFRCESALKKLPPATCAWAVIMVMALTLPFVP